MAKNGVGKKNIPWYYYVVWALAVIAILLLLYGIIRNLFLR